MAQPNDDIDDEIPIPFEENVPTIPDNLEIFKCGRSISIIFERLIFDYSSLSLQNQTTVNVQLLNTMIQQCRTLIDKCQSRSKIYHQRLQSSSSINFIERFHWLLGILNCERISNQTSWLGTILIGNREQLFQQFYPEFGYHSSSSSSIDDIPIMKNESDKYYQQFLAVGIKIYRFFHHSSSTIHNNRSIILQDLHRLRQLNTGSENSKQFCQQQQQSINQFVNQDFNLKISKSLQSFIDEYRIEIQTFNLSSHHRQQQRIVH